ncbi:hypothetical protein C8R44DRAFT_984569 [Mycena epipterygia]|nr:hypothetical protein C8R44DRAFT_984569 [Mycena epipterygia]
MAVIWNQANQFSVVLHIVFLCPRPWGTIGAACQIVYLYRGNRWGYIIKEDRRRDPTHDSLTPLHLFLNSIPFSQFRLYFMKLRLSFKLGTSSTYPGRMYDGICYPFRNSLTPLVLQSSTIPKCIYLNKYGQSSPIPPTRNPA